MSHASLGGVFWVPVLSTDLSHAKYDLDSGALRIRFHSGEVYEYHDVPRHVYDVLLAAPSKGKYFHQNIKGKYEFTRIR